MSHFLLSFLVECYVIKLDQINVSLSSFLLSLSPGLMEGLEFPTEHQLVKSDPIHGWFSCCHPHHIILHGNDTIVQFFSKVYFHAAITMLPARPIFPLLVEKGEGQVDNDLQLTGLHEPTYKQATRQDISDRHSVTLVSADPSLVWRIHRLLVRKLPSCRQVDSTRI